MVVREIDKGLTYPISAVYIPVYIDHHENVVNKIEIFVNVSVNNCHILSDYVVSVQLKIRKEYPSSHCVWL